jgi:TetR/AcrR family transcriptional regulator
MTQGHLRSTAMGELPRSRARLPRAPSSRSLAKRQLIVETAMRRFAEAGYQAARVEDIAIELGIAKGSVFQHFGSKQGLFMAAYKKAATMLPAYLECPPEVRTTGFFSIIEYWLGETPHLVREDLIPYRVTLLGNYAIDLELKREINRFLRTSDPYGTVAFVRYGIERGEIRTDMDFEMTVSMVDWLMEKFQDALVTEELDPGLFIRGGERSATMQTRIDQFLKLLRRAIGRR